MKSLISLLKSNTESINSIDEVLHRIINYIRQNNFGSKIFKPILRAIQSLPDKHT